MTTEIYYPSALKADASPRGVDPRRARRRPGRVEARGSRRFGDDQPVRRLAFLRRRARPDAGLSPAIAGRLASRRGARDAAHGVAGRRSRDGVSARRLAESEAAPLVVGHGSDPCRGAPRPVAHRAHRRARAAGSRRVGGCDHVGRGWASRPRIWPRPTLLDRGPTAVPASQRLAGARDLASPRSVRLRVRPVEAGSDRRRDGGRAFRRHEAADPLPGSRDPLPTRCSRAPSGARRDAIPGRPGRARRASRARERRGTDPRPCRPTGF